MSLRASSDPDRSEPPTLSSRQKPTVPPACANLKISASRMSTLLVPSGAHRRKPDGHHTEEEQGCALNAAFVARQGERRGEADGRPGCQAAPVSRDVLTLAKDAPFSDCEVRIENQISIWLSQEAWVGV